MKEGDLSSPAAASAWANQESPQATVADDDAHLTAELDRARLVGKDEA